ncbi:MULTISPECIES: hypothetical protein [unclassified Azospirillum]|uniref:hypothetical protein n=1 Tax=unclassified Azospirillum TaxID=2630922 RepID=UPI000B68B9D5|nr:MULTISPECIES: hypothetical protein [unclassified Azospirillum]SNS81428.1 hypothetical protein SAMN05880556_11291 [Azospirillum sp. RU38E]SNS98519.1 hypothetical protein SAMN05880591_11291 [Azospirillum sp. RU37A]
MSDSLSAGAAAPVTRNVLIVLLIRLAAVHVMALYAGIFTVIHWLRDVPLVESWIIGAIGFAMLFLAFGVMLTGRATGFFSTPHHRFSVDWLPLLLIWPLGLSLWSCFGLGLASMQARQHMANGVAMPLMLLAATVPPLLLGRIAPWPEQRRTWQKLLDAHYALATMAAAAALFLAIHTAVQQDSAMGNEGGGPASTASTTAATPGFVCDRTKIIKSDNEEEAADNQCPPVQQPAPLQVVAPGDASKRPIDRHASSWGMIWLLLAGAVLGVTRFIAARAATAHPATDDADADSALPAGATAQGADMAGRLMAMVRTQALSQAAALLRGSAGTAPNGDLLTDMVGKIVSRPASASPAALAPLLANTVAAVAAAPSASATPPAPEVPVPASVAPPPAAPAPEPVPVAPPPPDDHVAAALQEQVAGMNSALNKQQDTAAQLQSSVVSLQDKLEQQAQAMNQVMTESQRAAEESRRTIDSLTRLMQGMKADLERLSRSQSEAS